MAAKKKKPVKVGGKRAGSGRKKGGKNRWQQEAFAKAAATGELPLEYMLRVMRDARSSKPRRDGMAVAAAPYLHHRLATITVEGNKQLPLMIINRNMTALEAADAYANTLTIEHLE